ncbi:MAG: molybdopterin molybdotransferase MoeA, partial [Anaerolineaceae bacterium]|nr:molybdopterin molybdotransferase MoeA [Anaerolineaceae bacterium]
MASLMSVHEAQQNILAAFSPVSTTTVNVASAGGWVLAQDVITDIELPPFANSSMDGFAVRAADLEAATSHKPVILQVITDIPAGVVPEVSILPGQTARIMTGAPLPDGADAVVPIEETSSANDNNNLKIPDQVKVFRPVESGAFVRPRGQDVQIGQLALSAGIRLTPQDLGLLASLGISQVPVYRKPRLALFATGDELINPDLPLAPGKIR